MGLIKDELAERPVTDFPALRRKTCNYLTDNSNESKDPNGTKRMS